MDIPQIYIDYDSLLKKKEVIAKEYYCLDYEDDYLYKIFEALYNLVNGQKSSYDIVKFPSFNFIRIRPEFSDEYEIITRILDDFEIEYREAIN